MTETGKILKELKNLRKIENNNIKLALMYAKEHKLTLKEVGLYRLPNGPLIVDRYPSDKAKALFNEIRVKSMGPINGVTINGNQWGQTRLI